MPRNSQRSRNSRNPVGELRYIPSTIEPPTSQNRFILWFPIGVGILVCAAGMMWPHAGAPLFGVGSAIIFGSLLHLKLSLSRASLLSILIGLLVFSAMHRFVPDTDPQSELLKEISSLRAEVKTHEATRPKSNYHMGRIDDIYPGFSTRIHIRINDLIAERRNHFFSYTEKMGASVQLYISSIATLVFSVTDVHGEPYALVITTGKDGVPLGREVYLLCEVGTAPGFSFERIFVNGVLINELLNPFPIDLGTRIWGGTIGTPDATGSSSNFDMTSVMVRDITVTDAQAEALSSGP